MVPEFAGGRPTSNGATIYLNCPRCGLSIARRSEWLTVERCPRCIARGRVAVSLFASSLPSDELYSADARPRSVRIDPV
jgi:hypothetical protein